MPLNELEEDLKSLEEEERGLAHHSGERGTGVVLSFNHTKVPVLISIISGT